MSVFLFEYSRGSLLYAHLVFLFVQILYSVHHLVVPGNVSNSSLYMDFTAVLQVK